MISAEKKKIKDYIFRKRMISARNLYDYFCLTYEDIGVIINELLNENKVRTVSSHLHCSSGGNCHSCRKSEEDKNDIESLILVSLNKIRMMEE